MQTMPRYVVSGQDGPVHYFADLVSAQLFYDHNTIDWPRAKLVECHKNWERNKIIRIRGDWTA